MTKKVQRRIVDENGTKMTKKGGKIANKKMPSTKKVKIKMASSSPPISKMLAKSFY